MCVPVPVGDNVNQRGKVTGGFPAATLAPLNQMMTPFRKAATGQDLEQQRKRFTAPGNIATMLTPPPSPEMEDTSKGYRRPY